MTWRVFICKEFERLMVEGNDSRFGHLKNIQTVAQHLHL